MLQNRSCFSQMPNCTCIYLYFKSGLDIRSDQARSRGRGHFRSRAGPPTNSGRANPIRPQHLHDQKRGTKGAATSNDKCASNFLFSASSFNGYPRKHVCCHRVVCRWYCHLCPLYQYSLCDFNSIALYFESNFRSLGKW